MNLDPANRRRSSLFAAGGAAAWLVVLLGVGLVLGATPAAEGAPANTMFGGSLWDTMEKGGYIMYVILAASVVGVAFLFECLFRTRRAAILPKRFAEILASHEARGFLDKLLDEQGESAMRRVLRAGRYWRHGTNDQIQAAIEEAVDHELWTLRRSARPIGIVANTAPLLGLLGTVIGIIEAFDVVAQQGALGDPGALANGIAKALLTTWLGLIVAIPLLLCYHFLMGRIEALLRHCEALAKENLLVAPEAPAEDKLTE
jgi:biopolymer transport protein ExbB